MTSQLKLNPLSRQHKEWVSLFRQSSVSSSIQSLAFVKKLTAITLSTITYNRGVFATDQYDNYTLDGRPIKLLRGSHESKRAFLFTTCIKSAFQAIEKHYMRELTLEISSTEGNVIEFYKLFYSYEGDKGCISLIQENTSANRIHRLEDIQENTAKMLRCLTRFTQNLKPLPETYIVQLRITYYDEVTPLTYQPTFFSAGNPKELDRNLKKDSLGEIKTKYHTVDMESGSLLKYDPTVQQKTSSVLKSTTKKNVPEIVAIQDTDEDSVITSPSTFTIEQMSFGRFTVVSRSKTELIMPSNANKPSTSKTSDPNIYSLDCSEPMPSTSKIIKQGNKKGKSVIYCKSTNETKKSNKFLPVIENIEINEIRDSSVEMEEEDNNVHHSSNDSHMNIEQINILSSSSSSPELNEQHNTELLKNVAFSENQNEQVNGARAVSLEVSEVLNVTESTQDSLQDKIDRNEEINILSSSSSSPELKEQRSIELRKNVAFSENQNEQVSINQVSSAINESCDMEPMQNDPLIGEKQCLQASDNLSVKLLHSSSELILSSLAGSLPPLQIQVNTEAWFWDTHLLHKLIAKYGCNCCNEHFTILNVEWKVDAFTNLLHSESYRDIKSPISSPALDMANDPAVADEDYDSSESEGNGHMDLTPITIIHHNPEDKIIQPIDSSSPSDHQIADILIPPQLIKKEKGDSWESQEPTTGGYGTSGATSGKERYSFSDPVGICSYDLNLDYIKQKLSQSRETQDKKNEDEQIELLSAGDINNNEKYVSVQNQNDSDEEMERIKRLKLDHSPVIPSQGSPSYSSFVHTTKEASEEGDRNIKINCLCQKDFSTEVFKCQSCNTYHHVVCYGFMPGASAPLIGCCYQCASEANIPKLCSDPLLIQLDGDPALFAIYRQILINLSLYRGGGRHHISIEIIMSWIGSESHITDDYIQRLNDEGFIRPSSRKHNEFTIKVRKLEEAIKENFRTV